MTTTTYGLHLTLRLADVERRDMLDDQQAIADLLTTLVDRIGMRILAGPMVGIEEGGPERCGCSGVLILYESHAAIHTYSALGEVFLDIFSCRTFSIETVQETLSDYFGFFRVVEKNQFDRGIHWGRDVEREMTTWSSLRLPGLPKEEASLSR